MDRKIRVGIVGYGNLGRGVEAALKLNPDFELEAVFTRRDVSKVAADAKVVHFSEIEKYKGIIDVMLLCGGSATDLPQQSTQIAAMFNTVDSFDTHAKIPEYYDRLDKVAKKAGTLSLISTGWDPGLFSMMRLLTEAILPKGKTFTFWGKGVSQGHSDAVRRVPGVKKAVQYTIPVKSALDKVRSGENPELAVWEKHERVCYVVPEPGADRDRISETIKNMPHYFSDYNTTVHFITEEEFDQNHNGMPHGGCVIRTGETGAGAKQKMEFSLELCSNPEFTACVLTAYARAVYRMSRMGQTGARTVFDIPLGYLSPKTSKELRKELL
ncbi:MAG TPA: diaminopimelate dehydrogenase [Clostridiales bacterium]|nr:diaminopimelate dehydrogenase [Clostridiales bacterium]